MHLCQPGRFGSYMGAQQSAIFFDRNRIVTHVQAEIETAMTLIALIARGTL